MNKLSINAAKAAQSGGAGMDSWDIGFMCLVALAVLVWRVFW